MRPLALGVLALLALPAHAEEPKGAPFLWRVDGGPAPTYLFGTVHKVPVALVPPVVWAAFRGARTAAFEDLAPGDTCDVHPDWCFLPEGQRLDRLLGPELWGKLRSLADSNVDDEDLVRMRPFLAMSVFKWDEGSGNVESMDGHIMSMARSQGKRLVALESDEQHYSLADRGMTLEVLSNYLREPERFKRAASQLVRAYAAGDESAYRRIAASVDDLEPQATHDIVLKGRNETWLPKIEELIRQGGAIVVVGNSHFIERDNLIDLLRARGYKVERASSETAAVTRPRPGLIPAPSNAFGELDASAKR